jgi:2'-5' RNA ligase
MRLFIGLPVDDEVRRSLSSVHGFLLSNTFPLKIVAPENYHITIKFFGECEGNVAKAIESTFCEIPVAGGGELPFSVEGLGAFPDVRKPSVLWAGLNADHESLMRLYRSVDRYAANFRFKEEKREFTPHLTLARVKSGRKIAGDLLKYLESNRRTHFGDSSFKRLALFSSKLTPEGAVYTELKSIAF